MAKTTASASGTKRYRATPLRKNMGTKTMQMDERGDQRGDGDLRRAVEDGLLDLLARFEIAVDVLDFDGGVVDQDADGQRQAAEGHDVDGLAEGARASSEERIESGMETAMMSVLRQLPRKTRIMIAVRQAAMMASRTTPLMARAHEDRLIAERR